MTAITYNYILTINYYYIVANYGTEKLAFLSLERFPHLQIYLPTYL